MADAPELHLPDTAYTGAPKETAIPMLVEQEGPRLLTLARRFCGDPDQADDLVQEVFLAAYRSWDQFRGESQVGTWLYRIAARTCMRMQRKRSGEPDRVESLEELMPGGEPRLAWVPGPDDEPLSEEVREEGRQAVLRAMVGLPENFRMPMVLKEIVGFSVAQVAAILDIPEATVKTRLHRGRMRMRKALDQAMPTHEVPPTELDKAICMDLLEAKQSCMDRGEPFQFPAGLFCERCGEVFRTLDFTQELCRMDESEPWPKGLEGRILTALRAESA